VNPPWGKWVRIYRLTNPTKWVQNVNYIKLSFLVGHAPHESRLYRRNRCDGRCGRRGGEEIIIVRDKTPVAKLVPIAPPKSKRAPASMKGRIALDPSFFEPLPEDELGRWE
jgi:hypothetical protein